MGIRVVCPNGHRLNLKSHLAGHRGLCPQCGSRFRIPFESSDNPQPRDERSEAPHQAEPLEKGQIPEEAQPQAASPKAPIPTSTGDFQNADDPFSSPAREQQTPATEDPFTLAAVWYVQAPTGERYGPASSDMMRKWIDEGRVHGDCLVWRDGWSAWEPATTILAFNHPASSADVGLLDGPATVTPGPRQTYSRGAASERKAALLILLLLVSLVLLGGVILGFVSGQLSFGS